MEHIEKSRFAHDREAISRPSLTFAQDAMRRLVKNKVALVCVVIIVILLMMIVEPGMFTIIVAYSIVGWIPMARLVRGQVVAQILYGAIYADKRARIWEPELFRELENRFPEICPGFPELAQMIQVREVENLYFWLDALSNRGICAGERPSR